MTTETQWAARKFWRDTYVSGVRITFNGGEFRFFRCLWPSRLRVETFGQFGHFPVEPMQPTAELCAALEPHKAELARFLHQPVPTKLSGRFNHLLSREHEFYPLQVDAEELGYYVSGLPLEGGIFPILAGMVTDKNALSPVKLFEVKPILSSYLEDCRNGKQERANGYDSVARYMELSLSKTSTRIASASRNGENSEFTRRESEHGQAIAVNGVHHP